MSRRGDEDRPFSTFLKKLSTIIGQPIPEEIDHLLRIIMPQVLAAREWEKHVTEKFDELTRAADDWIDENPPQQPVDNDLNPSIEPSNVLDSVRRQRFVKEATKKIEDIAAEYINFIRERAEPSPSLSTTSSTISPNRSKGKGKAIAISDYGTGTSDHPPIMHKTNYIKFEVEELRKCLLCFSVFPENEAIKKRVIIYWWIGEGFVTRTRYKTAEQVGELFFRMLLSAGLIEPIYQKHNKNIQCCKLRPEVLETLKRNAEEIDFFERCDCQRRAILMATTELQAVKVSSESKKADQLITAFNKSAQYLKFENDKLLSSPSIKVLHLGRWQTSSPKHHIEVNDTKFLESLRLMKNLRYLSLRGISRITQLPDSVAGLTNLLVLDLRACHNLEILSTKITLLKKLTHLDVSDCYLLEQMPKGLDSLSELEVVKGFVIRDSTRKDGCELGELARLKKLWKLSIRIGTGAHRHEELNNLSKFTSLSSLTLTWGRVLQSEASSAAAAVSSSSSPKARQVKQVLSPKKSFKGIASKVLTSTKSKLVEQPKQSITMIKPPPNLEKLNLQCILDEETPDWLKPDKFQKLKRLYIIGGRLRSLSLASSDPEGSWRVEMLRLKFLRTLNSGWPELKSALPMLKQAQIHECRMLESPPPLDEIGVWMKTDDDIWSSSDQPSTSRPS